MYANHISVPVHCNGVYSKCNIVPNVFLNENHEKKNITDTLYEQNK